MWCPLLGLENWGSAGLAEWRRGTVEELDVGDAACEAMDSTSSMEWACQPWLTFTIAYDSRVLRSEVSCRESKLALQSDFHLPTKATKRAQK